MKLEMVTQIYILLLICSIKGSVQLSREPKDESLHKVTKKEFINNPDDKIPHLIVHKETVKLDTNTTNSTKPPSKGNVKVTENDSPQIESGTVIRGVLVFVGISMIFILYLGCKTYRKRNLNVIVRKYGVRTRRSDVEMRPLPLDDDDEDETVFDVGNLNKS